MTEIEGVVPALAQALEKRGYTELTPVQKSVLGPELVSADALVSAQTGSGKTVAFGIAFAPTLLAGEDRFGRASAPLALVIAPTRELALQVKRELEWLYSMTGASIASCVGGMDMRTERRNLNQGAHIVVGTPGRLRDHIERGSLDNSSIKAVVLDEADEMLDMGFRDDLEYILGATPKSRQTLMFSATVPRAIASLAKRYQRDAVRVSTVAERSQHGDIEYRALSVAPNDRENAIVNVLRYYAPKGALVFCATRATVNRMTSRFSNRGFSVVALSGELSQNERTHALQALRDGRAQICIATDVAARGIDLPNLDLVIHADLPKNKEGLLHRSGRTGRAGRKGVCALIVPHNVRKRTERLLGSAGVSATWGKPPSVKEIALKDRERILTSTTLTEPLSEDEKVFATELLEKFGPEQVAAAFLRQHVADQTAPEELLDNAPTERVRAPRDDFAKGVWFSISVGHEHNAEPRWILPTMCRAGGITKKEIGAIKIYQNESHVELEPGCVDRFLEAIGPSRKIEKTIDLTRLEGTPTPPSESRGPRPRKERDYAKKRPFGERREGNDRDDKPYGKKKARSDRSRPDRGRTDYKSRDQNDDKPPAKQKHVHPPKATFADLEEEIRQASEPTPRKKLTLKSNSEEEGKGGSRDDKPWKKAKKDKGKKLRNKKPHKGKIARAAAKSRGGGTPGSRPLKRNKPSNSAD